MENITTEQRALLDELQAMDDALEVEWDDIRGVAASIHGQLDYSAPMGAEGQVAAFLESFGPLVGPPDLPHGLQVLQRERDDLEWEHLVYAYLVDGEIELYGAKFVAHLDAEGTLVDVESSLFRDLDVDTGASVAPDEVSHLLRRRIEGLDGFGALRDSLEADEPDFPATDPPRPVVMPVGEELRLAWATYGYSDIDEHREELLDVPVIEYGHIFVDAITGERVLFAPTRKLAETKTTGSGSAVTPLSGTKHTRSLNIVRVDTSKTYRLKDKTHKRDMITYDAACDSKYDAQAEIRKAIKDGKLPVSEDTDGDHNWKRLPKNTTAAERTAGQQPEVDAHYHVRLQYEWYKALASREGWDNGKYKNPPVPHLTLHAIAHCRMYGTCQISNAFEDLAKSGGTWETWIAFADGDRTPYGYKAGSRWIVAHEYQHAITDYSFQDASGNPGLLYWGWPGAVHEGLSDTFASLSSEQWLPCRDISHTKPAKVSRNMAYPRDTNAKDPNNLDHFAERDNHPAGTTEKGKFYRRGTILAHCAYLMGKGGVHQRASRTPQLIPVPPLGRQTVGGKSVLRAARIWYRALDKHASSIGSLTGTAKSDESSFRTLRTGCVKAAEAFYGKNSAEYHNTILAFYAVGLHPVDTKYGADPTFLRWGHDWDLSRKYVGLTSPNYSSLDLFINNGGKSEWNALINVTDPSTGKPTEYENAVYCRVRNVGDQQANNVEVEFHYAKAGTATWKWQAVVDKSGKAQKLSLGNLAAGASNFADSAQNSPPATAAIKWCIPPLGSGEKVDHYCLRARVKSNNDTNPHNNEVQSNIAYTAYAPPKKSKTVFVAGNPYPEDDLDLDVKMEVLLPREWRVSLQGLNQGELLRPGEERLFDVTIDFPPGADQTLEPPLDGDLTGMVQGDFSGRFTGSLDETTMMPGNRVIGQFSALIHRAGPVSGFFSGSVDLNTGEVHGRVAGPDPLDVNNDILLTIDGCLRPWRRVEVSQWDGQELVGGVTVQVQVPWQKSPCAFGLPPTDTAVTILRKIPPVVMIHERLLRRFSLEGELLAEWIVEPGIRSFAVAREGEVVVVALEAPLLQVYSPDGELLHEWEVPGGVHGVAAGPGGEVLVTVPADNMVLYYSPDGQLLTEWQVPGEPTGIAVNHEGEVFVVCEGGHLMAVLRPDGEPLAEWGVDCCVIETNGIATGAYGEIWTASQDLIVTGYMPDGQILARWELEDLPTSISAGPEGEVVVVLRGRHVLLFDPDGGLLHEWEAPLP